MTWTHRLLVAASLAALAALYVGLRQADALIITPDVYMNTYQYGTRIYIVGPDQPTQRVLNTPAYDV